LALAMDQGENLRREVRVTHSYGNFPGSWNAGGILRSLSFPLRSARAGIFPPWWAVVGPAFFSCGPAAWLRHVRRKDRPQNPLVQDDWPAVH